MGNVENKEELEEFVKVKENLNKYLSLNKKDYLSYLVNRVNSNKTSFVKSEIKNKVSTIDILDLTIMINDNLHRTQPNVNFVTSSLFSNIAQNNKVEDISLINGQNNFLDEIINGNELFCNNQKSLSKKIENSSIKLEESIKLANKILIPSNSIKKYTENVKGTTNINDINDSLFPEKFANNKLNESSKELSSSIIIKNIETKQLNMKDPPIINSKLSREIPAKKMQAVIPNTTQINKKKKRIKKSNKPAIVNIKIDLRDVQRENLIENYLNRSRINNSISPNAINRYTTKSKSPDPRDTSFKVFIDKCTHANDSSILSTKDNNTIEIKKERSNNLKNSKYSGDRLNYTDKILFNKTNFISKENDYKVLNSSKINSHSNIKRLTFGTYQRASVKNDDINEKKPNISNLYRELKKLRVNNDEVALERIEKNHHETKTENKKNELDSLSICKVENPIEELNNLSKIEKNQEREKIKIERISEIQFIPINNQKELTLINIKADKKYEMKEIDKKPIIIDINGPSNDRKSQKSINENNIFNKIENDIGTIDDNNKKDLNIHLNLRINNELGDIKYIPSKFKPSSIREDCNEESDEEEVNERRNVEEKGYKEEDDEDYNEECEEQEEKENEEQQQEKNEEENEEENEEDNEEKEEDEIMRYYRNKNKILQKTEDENLRNDNIEIKENSLLSKSKNKTMSYQNKSNSSYINPYLDTKKSIKGNIYLSKENEDINDNYNSNRNKNNEKSNKTNEFMNLKPSKTMK